MRFKPFTPVHFITAFIIRLNVLEYRPGQYTALLLGMTLFRSGSLNQIPAAGISLVLQNVLHRCVRLLHHLIDRHKSSGPSGSCLAVEMKPDAFLQVFREIDKRIDDFTGRPAVIGAGKTQIVHALALRQRPLGLPLFHGKFQAILRPVVLRCICRDSRSDQTGKRFLLRFHLFRRFSQIGSIILPAPGNSNSIDEAMALQPAVDDPDVFRLFLQFRCEISELRFRELRAAGHAFLLKKTHIGKLFLPGVRIIPVNADKNTVLRCIKMERKQQNRQGQGCNSFQSTH